MRPMNKYNTYIEHWNRKEVKEKKYPHETFIILQATGYKMSVCYDTLP
jgi:hypothetical protein